MHRAIDLGALKIGLELGIFLVIGAGIIGIVAAIVAMMGGGEVTPPAMGMPTATAAGAGMTNWAAGTTPPPPPAMPTVPPAESPWATPPPQPAPPEDPGQQ